MRTFYLERFDRLRIAGLKFMFDGRSPEGVMPEHPTGVYVLLKPDGSHGVGHLPETMARRLAHSACSAPMDLVALSEIAGRLDYRSHEPVRRHRDSDSFPTPAWGPDGNGRAVWDWVEVLQWYRERAQHDPALRNRLGRAGYLD